MWGTKQRRKRRRRKKRIARIKTNGIKAGWPQEREKVRESDGGGGGVDSKSANRKCLKRLWQMEN